MYWRKKSPVTVNGFACLPGVTGLAQVNLPPDSGIDSVRRKLRLDVEYIKTADLVARFSNYPVHILEDVLHSGQCSRSGLTGVDRSDAYVKSVLLYPK